MPGGVPAHVRGRYATVIEDNVDARGEPWLGALRPRIRLMSSIN